LISGVPAYIKPQVGLCVEVRVLVLSSYSDLNVDVGAAIDFDRDAQDVGPQQTDPLVLSGECNPATGSPGEAS